MNFNFDFNAYGQSGLTFLTLQQNLQLPTTPAYDFINYGMGSMIHVYDIHQPITKPKSLHSVEKLSTLQTGEGVQALSDNSIESENQATSLTTTETEEYLPLLSNVVTFFRFLIGRILIVDLKILYLNLIKFLKINLRYLYYIPY